MLLYYLCITYNWFCLVIFIFWLSVSFAPLVFIIFLCFAKHFCQQMLFKCAIEKRFYLTSFLSSVLSGAVNPLHLFSISSLPKATFCFSLNSQPMFHLSFYHPILGFNEDYQHWSCWLKILFFCLCTVLIFNATAHNLGLYNSSLLDSSTSHNDHQHFLHFYFFVIPMRWDL